MRSGEYPLTRLAAAVVEYFLADEVLTRESLTLLTGTLRAQFAEVLAAAKKAGGENVWRQKVVGPLRVTVGRRGEWPDDLDLREAPSSYVSSLGEGCGWSRSRSSSMPGSRRRWRPCCNRSAPARH